MKKQTKYILLALAGLLFFAGPVAASSGSYIDVLRNFIPLVEGFSPVPIWDYKQWSWGYGTWAGDNPNIKPTGTISREKAWADANNVIKQHYNTLKGRVQRNLTGNQWAALLSFSYNAGPGNAYNIIDTINTGTADQVVARMKKYIYAGGKVNQGLINRRKKETDLYLGDFTGRYQEIVPEFTPAIPWGEIGEYEY